MGRQLSKTMGIAQRIELLSFCENTVYLIVQARKRKKREEKKKAPTPKMLMRKTTQKMSFTAPLGIYRVLTEWFTLVLVK